MNFEVVKELYLQGKTIEEIHVSVGGRIDNLLMCVNEIKKTYTMNGLQSKIDQIHCIENELFKRIELEQLTGRKDKSIDSLTKVYSTYLIN